jgi:hypothetical protein
VQIFAMPPLILSRYTELTADQKMLILLAFSLSWESWAKADANSRL